MEKRAPQTLSSSQIREILRRLTTATRTSLAHEFGVSPRTITRIKQTYKDPSKVPIIKNSDASDPDNVVAAGSATRVNLRKKQINLDYKARKRIIKRLNAGKTIEALAKKYGVSYRTVQRLWRYQDVYLAKINAVKESHGSLGTKRLTNETPLDKAVVAWYRSEVLELGVDEIPGNTIRKRALQINKELGGSPSFKASGGWLWSFKNRYHLTQTVGQVDPLSSAGSSSSISDASDDENGEGTATRSSTAHQPNNFVPVREKPYILESVKRICPEEAYKAATTLANFVEVNMPEDADRLEVVHNLRDRIFKMIY